MEKIIKEESKLFISSCGIKRWYLKNGDLHRENGPAIIMLNGYKAWHLNNKPIFYNIQKTFEWTNNTLNHKPFIFNNLYLLNK